MVSLSSPNNRERVDLARSSVNGIFPVGRPVIVCCYPKTGNFGANPAVIIRYYPASSQACGGPLAAGRAANE